MKRLLKECPFSIAQVTVLSSMILIAHTLPIELSISQKAGVKLWYVLVLRILGAFVLGWSLGIGCDGKIEQGFGTVTDRSFQ